MVVTKETCLHHPGMTVFSRGVCRSCYMDYYRNVSRGIITEHQAIRQKIVLRCKRSGGTRSILPFPKTQYHRN